MKRIHLLACDRCKRQLDVTALEVGDEVQCVCDTVHVVGPPRLVQIRGLACGHCGGILLEGDTSCSFCKAALAPEEVKQTTLCPVCTTRLPNDSNHCNHCGNSLRIAAVPPIPKGSSCPRCKGELRVHLRENAEVIECGSDSGCGGMWCTRETFERLVQNVKRAVTDGSIGGLNAAKAPEILVDLSDSPQRYIQCLHCDDLMIRRQYRYEGKPSRIVIDVCRDHGVWFDRDELHGVLAFIRTRLTKDARIDLPALEWTTDDSDGLGPPRVPGANPGSGTPQPVKRGTVTFPANDSPLEVLLRWVSDFFLGH